ncbi:MAG TPA: hypothetical protein VK427_07750 [Kofleriaceae bacterium]|nr:hypothetical protein [Kofleriaceae bacterium]
MLRCLVLAILISASVATARTEKSLAYTREAAWPTAVRFIRVDEGLRIIEKDAEAGYVLFELKEEGKTFRGALEVMTVVVDGRSLVKFVLQIDDRPSWMEIAMLTRLERKLRAELGSPAPAPSKKPKDAPVKPEDAPKPPDDGGLKISPTP